MVALLGKPNVGKSTAMNLLIGQKISIVSNKAQTTRRRVLGILTEPEYQIIFVDTPGVHKAHTQLGKVLNEVAQSSMDTDVLLVVVDAHKLPDDEDKAIADLMVQTGWLDPVTRKAKPNVILCLNKMDLLKAHHVEENYAAYGKLFGTERRMFTSLEKRQNLDNLLDMVLESIPEGPPLYPEDAVTDQPMRLLAAEIVREKVLRLTKQEIPHSVATQVDIWEEGDHKVHIDLSIIVEKDSQKAIIIGAKGAMIKRIGMEARPEIEGLVGKPVYLELFVKVREGWRQNPRMLRDLEYMD